MSSLRQSTTVHSQVFAWMKVDVFAARCKVIIRHVCVSSQLFLCLLSVCFHTVPWSQTSLQPAPRFKCEGEPVLPCCTTHVGESGASFDSAACISDKIRSHLDAEQRVLCRLQTAKLECSGYLRVLFVYCMS